MDTVFAQGGHGPGWQSKTHLWPHSGCNSLSHVSPQECGMFHGLYGGSVVFLQKHLYLRGPSSSLYSIRHFGLKHVYIWYSNKHIVNIAAHFWKISYHAHVGSIHFSRLTFTLSCIQREMQDRCRKAKHLLQFQIYNVNTNWLRHTLWNGKLCTKFMWVYTALEEHTGSALFTVEIHIKQIALPDWKILIKYDKIFSASASSPW